MTHLSVLVRWPWGIAAERLVPLEAGMRLGEGPGARVVFPGADLRVGRDRFGWTLAGHRLLVGRRLVFELGELEVYVELQEESVTAATPRSGPHVLLVLGTAAIVLLGASIEVAWRVMEVNPEAAVVVQARLLGDAPGLWLWQPPMRDEEVAPAPPSPSPPVGFAG